MKGILRTSGCAAKPTRAPSSTSARDASTAHTSRTCELSSTEALHWADFERADSIRREIDFLATQLAQAFGRDGRARNTGDPIERVRKAVTNRIHHAIERVAKGIPPLAGT